MLTKQNFNAEHSISFFSLKTVQIILDISILCAAFAFTYLLRFDFSLTSSQARSALFQMLFVVPLQIGVMRLYNVHKFIWRYISVTEVRRIVTALLAAVIPLILLRLFLPANLNFASVPLSITILDFCLATIGILGVRLVRREIYETMRRPAAGGSSKDKKAVLLIGAGRAGVLTLSEVKNRRDLDFEVKGFIDDDKFKRHSVINGVEVIGTTDELPQIVRQLNIDHVIVTIANTSRREFSRIFDICKSIPIKVKTIPAITEILQEKVIVSRIRDVEVEDLLGRLPVELDKESIEAFLSNKVVMVTGAGGSIGSELVRQILRCRPKKIVLVEQCEFALFTIERELRERAGDVEIAPVIGDVCDGVRMRYVFETFGPQVVFHAAAYKHVPMMELNTIEALKNNALGTNIIGRLAGESGVEAFVLISTDKAVNPASVMGASKRVAELILQDLNNHFETRFVAVRFGNVIGSNGSVIPIFREQIKKGGPVTVTHPDMKRFFMTIPEASQLVLQSGAIGKGGEIFILDMGEPVRILDLARETIRLSGLKPDEDIQIVFTGMRPGEKLTEELETDAEQLTKTSHSKIFIGKIAPFSSEKIGKVISTLENLCRLNDDGAMRAFLAEILCQDKLKTDACTAEKDSPKKETVLLPQYVTAATH
jgi:FlaA1/EpsC-like NDP-sugar epimerase